MRRANKTKVVRAKDRDRGAAPLGKTSYIDMEQIKRRYGAAACGEDEALVDEDGLDNEERPVHQKVRDSREELRMPGERGKKKKRNRAPAALALCVAVLIGALAGLYFLMLIDEIEVQGNITLEKSEILTIAGINAGEHILIADTAGARKALMSEPYIKDARIKRIYPDKLLIAIEERIPVAAIEGSASAAVIDKDGYVMEITDTKPEGIITIYGVSAAGFAANSSLREYSKFNSDVLVEILGALWDQEILDIIDSIDLSQPLKITMKTTYGYDVNIGQPDNLSEKLDDLSIVLNKVMEMGKDGGTLDLGVLGDPVYAPPEVYCSPTPCPEEEPSGSGASPSPACSAEQQGNDGEKEGTIPSPNGQ